MWNDESHGYQYLKFMAAMQYFIKISHVSVASKMFLNFQASLTNIFVALLSSPMWMPGSHNEMVTTAAFPLPAPPFLLIRRT
jgi:hypothetical protein